MSVVTEEKMISLKEVLFLLWFAACAKALCSSETICITNGDEGESQCQQNHQIFHMLSDLTINQTSCGTVHIYLTSGTHILSRNLDFSNSVQETVICGASQGLPSIIECQGETGIEFSENTSVRMELVELLNCNRTRNIHRTLQATLFFKNVQYTLSGVTVKNTEGWGVYAEDCWEQIIFNCTFINNKGNIAIRGTTPNVQVEINDTTIYDGKKSDPSIADCNGLDVHLINTLSINFRIINCDLQRNQGGHFHLYMSNYIPCNNFTLLIDNSTFNTSDDYGVGMGFTCNRYNNIDVTLRRSSFSKNNKSGLFLIDTTHSKIKDCIFDSNRENGVEVKKLDSDNYHLSAEISNTTFSNNSRSTFKAALFFENVQYTLSGVTVKNTEGWGVYAEDCGKQIIFDSTFINNKVNIAIRGTAQVILVEIKDTKIHDGKQSDQSIADCNGIDVHLRNILNFSFKIVNCDLQRNQGGHFHLYISNYITCNNFTILIDNSTFNTSDDYGVAMQFICDLYNIIAVTMRRSSFSKNDKSGLFLTDTTYSKIENCTFDSNKDTAVEVLNDNHLWTEISNAIFLNNSRAIFLAPNRQNSIDAKISECRFVNHTGNSVTIGDTAAGVVNIGDTAAGVHVVTIEKSSFQGNRKLKANRDCSVLSIESINNITLSDVNITDNNCTGIKLIHSTMKLENLVTLSGNRGQNGGGLYLSMSKLIFSTSSKLNIINNSADAYGGAIYIEEETCTSDNTCFFQLEEEYPLLSSEVIALSGNYAKEGGDQMVGGCLSNCSIQFNKKKTFLSVCDLNNMFWELVSSTNNKFLGHQKRLTFCKNSEDSSASGYLCSNSKSIHVYRGQMFNVPLMVADDCCFPLNVDYIEAKTKSPLQFKENPIQKSRKTCYNYSYTLKGGFGLKVPTTIEFTIPQHVPSLVLTVILEECPFVYKEDSESGECVCHDILESHNVKCIPSNKSLHIPAQTWLGELWNESESMAVQNNCKYCKTKEMDLTIPIDSNKLCISRYSRTGIMCGACASNYSLLLGGYKCADCSRSTYKGVLLFLAFIAIGIVLVILLLGLDLTVSTGMVNGLIFYSNIVYLNSDTMLPITREENSTHLQNTVRILSTFQAWMNLDFGISTCFFDGYDTYISTWMQFVFPLYIWLLILIIILTSRYSRRITKLITSNIVSVLATLLLLSYAKLLKTSSEVFSHVQLQLLNGNVTNRWKPDANIPYLGQLHVPLFLMSLAMVLVYMIPFTLLILLGPLLQAKSHYRVLHWINRLKPFHDAFYGPYTSKYRYWPGILLLARLLLLGAFSSYSSNDFPFKLFTVSMIAAALLVLWMVIGRKAISIYQINYLNYLELYFLINLLAFSALSIYTTKFSINNLKAKIQQVLTVVMVGSVLAVSCGIIGYKIFCISIKCRAVHNISRFLLANLTVRRKEEPQNSTKEQEDSSTKTTHSLVELTECETLNNELREPLLTSQVHES